MYVERDVQRAMEMLVAGTVPVDEIVTATYPLDQIEQAFAAAHSGDEVKVHVRVAG
jgi:Zn-dependent alcohol dehydrogenase